MVGSRGWGLQIIFRRYDRDGSGTISASELTEVAYKMGHPMTEEQYRFHAPCAVDGSGELNYSEFKRWWANKDRFTQLEDQPAHEDEQAAEQDMAAAAAWTKWVDSVVAHFEFFDKDHSGSISRDEFGELFQNLRGNGYDLPSTPDAALAVLDANGDGSVSLREYVQWMRRTGSH
ncbi:uncharacterized protein MONBRDRAFT_22474 [Monosiga brevicollis MX1]|uniref:EF-hand domain-containing protein n=1 Tax=Monosiga brevicollis TaxID=81824 RepID=A9UQP4_MONBE|nr:uncharacterized protein MONBRDRAFT_22474 [Monosiga brevicollis MX1]EDQ93080.1 predicted protein [Monosiga brevicollis MX1]|eukprot:XP_001742842.1 hypothetical protein [Monosiga brevicollis MX1]